MSGLEAALFNLKVRLRARAGCCLANPHQFTAKSLNRQALKAGKDEQTEKAKVEKVRSTSTVCLHCTDAVARP